jgi:hypothetical protein
LSDGLRGRADGGSFQHPIAILQLTQKLQLMLKLTEVCGMRVVVGLIAMARLSNNFADLDEGEARAEAIAERAVHGVNFSASQNNRHGLTST